MKKILIIIILPWLGACEKEEAGNCECSATFTDGLDVMYAPAQVNCDTKTLVDPGQVPAGYYFVGCN